MDFFNQPISELIQQPISELIQQPISELIQQGWQQGWLQFFSFVAVYLFVFFRYGRFLFKNHASPVKPTDDDKVFLTLGAVFWPIILPSHLFCLICQKICQKVPYVLMTPRQRKMSK